MARTDTHRPSSLDFDPQDYELVAFGDNHPEDGHRPRLEINDLRKQGYKASEYAQSSNCTHCGHALRYFALLTHQPSKTWIYVGEDCLDNRFDLSKGEFQALRVAGKLNAERRTKAAKIAALIEAHPFLATLKDSDNEFLQDIGRKFQRDGVLTDRQIAAAEGAQERAAQWEADRLAKAAFKAAQIASGEFKAAPKGRVTVTGKIVAVRSQDNAYSYYGGRTYSILVETDEGWKVWVTRPAAIGEADKNDVVTFTATLTPSQNDPFVASGKRPSNAQILQRQI